MILHFTRRGLALATGTRRREAVKDNDYDKTFKTYLNFLKSQFLGFSKLNVLNVHATDKSKYIFIVPTVLKLHYYDCDQMNKYF